MIRAPVEIELARLEWEHGRRRVESAASDPARNDRLILKVEILTAELRRRIGVTFTLEELAEAYDGADRWALEALHRALPEDAPSDTSTAADAAFSLYARRALDYAP
jgi:hypothetical protein